MAKKLSPKMAKAIKQLDQIPDRQLKFFFKILLLAKDCGIDVFKKGEPHAEQDAKKAIDRAAKAMVVAVKASRRRR